MELMSEESREAPERARKNLSALLTGLSRMGQVNVARELGCSEAKVSKMKDGELEMFAKLLAACELKVVPTAYRCAKPEIIDAALVFARAALEQTARCQSLVWDD
jgi:hypothetical protein